MNLCSSHKHGFQSLMNLFSLELLEHSTRQRAPLCIVFNKYYKTTYTKKKKTTYTTKCYLYHDFFDNLHFFVLVGTKDDPHIL